MDLRAVRPAPPRTRRSRLGAGAGRGRGVRHPGAALVRQHRRRTSRDPQHLRTARRANERPHATFADVAQRPVTAMTALLESKYRVPSRRPYTVARPRLDERLKAACRVPLTVLSAPAGFGKTTMLTEWLASVAG